MSLSRLLLVSVLSVLVALARAAAAAPPSAPEAPWPQGAGDLSPSPRVTWGELSNGVRYAILPNATPRQRVSLRLLVATGSLHEKDDELGYAHFVEHMAFNGTERYPAGQLVLALQTAGVSFGPHVNAYTGYNSTLYKLELTENTPERLAEGFTVLRDFADGIIFDQQEVRRERGVILNESLTRSTPERLWTEALNRFIYDGTRVPHRPPLGTRRSIQRATGERLRAFYDRWYRPERLFIVVVGDVQADHAKAMLEAEFLDLRARGPAPAEPPLGELASSATPLVQIHRSSRAGIEFNLFSLRPSPPRPDTRAEREREFQLDAALSMLRERFRRIVAQPEAPLTSFVVRHDRVLGAFSRIYITAVGPLEKASDVLQRADQERRRACEHGFDPSELDLYRTALRSSIEAAAREAATQSSPDLADDLASAIESGRVFNLADEEEEQKLAALERLTTNDCWAALREEWNQGQEILFVSVDADRAPRASEVSTWLRDSRKKPVAPPAPVRPLTFAYENFGAAGGMASQRHIEDLDLWLVRFSNGVRLNVKSTQLERNKVLFNIRLGSGRFSEPASHPGLTQWAGAGWIFGGVRKHSVDEVLQALNGRVGGFRALGGDDAMVLAGHAPASHLNAFFAIATAYVSDPSFDSSAEKRIKPFLNTLYTELSRTSAGPTQRAILPYLSGCDGRFGIPSYDDLDAQTMETLETWMRPMLRSGPIEIGIVGDIGVEAAIALVAETFGTLPPREPKTFERERRRLHLPRPPAMKRYVYPSEIERPSLVALYWPIRDTVDATLRRQLQILSEVLEDRVRVKVREELSATYAPNASFSHSDIYPGFAHLKCDLQAQPRAAERLLSVARELSNDLAKHGVTAEEVARARAQSLALARQNLQTNTYWLEHVVSDAQEHPDRLEAARTLISDLENVTVSDLNSLAARYLTDKNLFRFIVDAKH